MDRDAYIEKAKATLDKWNAEIDKMEARTREAQADAKLTFEAQLKEMRDQRDKAEEQLKDAREASEKAWDEMSKSFAEGLETINEGFKRAMQSFR